MTLQQQQFLELLRSGLWGTPADTNLFNGNVDWKTILRIAMEQTVQVIVADGIETLPKELWPPKEAMLKLMMVRVKTNQMHQLLNSTLNQIVNALNAEGISSVLLKGQGVAQNYRNPESRMCGDIDLYVGEKNYERACEIIDGLGKGEMEGIESEHHMHLKVNGVEVEVHRKVAQLLNKCQDKDFQRLATDSIDSNFDTPLLGTWGNADTDIRLAPVTFDAFFILHHAVRHMTREGIGFRHICDWTMYLHKHHQDIEAEELSRILKEFNMETVWKEFGLMAINHLKLPSEEFPSSPATPHSRKTDSLIRHIFISGNFGRFDANGRDYSKTSYLKRKWRSFRFQSMRLCKLFVLFPSYIISYGWGWLTTGIYVGIRRK